MDTTNLTNSESKKDDSIKDAISNIIKTRATTRQKYTDYRSWILKIKEECDSFEQLKNEKNWNHLLANFPKVNENWINLKKCVETIQPSINSLIGEKGLLDQALRRLNRDYINICNVGAWRQGKSAMLKTLTDLSDNIIPEGDKDSCTGTVISVFNGKEFTINEKGEKVYSGGNKAYIYFYTLDEICELIRRYINFLGLNIPFPTPENAEMFSNQCKKLKDNNLFKDKSLPKDKVGYFATLKEYVENVDDYKDCLGCNRHLIENLNEDENSSEFREYVCFYSEDPDSLVRKCKVLGVKKAEVYTDFKIAGQDVGEIKFVDTPGIGEKRVGLDASVAEVLKKEADISIAIAKVPEQDLTLNHDIQSFNAIMRDKDIRDRNPSKWLFYLINSTGKRSKEEISEFRRKVIEDFENGENGIKLHSTHYHPANAKNQDELHSFFLQILETMEKEISETDKYFIETAYTKYKDVISDYEHIKELKTIVFNNLPNMEGIQSEIIHNTLNAIQEGLKDIIRKLKQNSVDSIIGKKLKDIYNYPVSFDLLEIVCNEDEIRDCITSGMEIKDEENEKNEVYELLDKKIVELLSIQNLLQNDNTNEYDSIFQEETLEHFKKNPFKLLAQKIKVEIDSEVDRQNEFSVYSFYKRKLYYKINSKFENIDEKCLREAVRKFKNDIWKVFIEKGKLSFKGQTAESGWLNTFINHLEKEKNNNNLIEILKELEDTEVSIKKHLLGGVDDIMKKSFRHDWLGYNFGGENADTKVAIAFTKSLINLEFITKKALEKACNSEEDTKLSAHAQNNMIKSISQLRIRLFPLVEFQHAQNELINYYKKHYDMFFGVDEQKSVGSAIAHFTELYKTYEEI